MMRSSWAFRLFFVPGMAVGLTFQGNAQETAKPAASVITPSRIQLPVQNKPAQPGAVTSVKPKVESVAGNPQPAPKLPAPRLVEAPKPNTMASQTVTVIALGSNPFGGQTVSGCDCGLGGMGAGSPQVLTPAQTRQLEALRIDRLSPTEAPRYGKNQPVPPINCEVPAAEAYVEGLRALKRFDSARALALFNHALSMDPTHPATLQLKAVALYDLGRDAEAAKAARQGKYFAREQPGGLEELSRALEPIQGHRRAFLDHAALYNLTGEPQDCCNPTVPGGVIMGAPITPDNPLKPGTTVEPARAVEPKPPQPGVVNPPAVPKPPVNTDTPKPAAPRIKLPPTNPAPAVPAQPAVPNGPKL